MDLLDVCRELGMKPPPTPETNIQCPRCCKLLDRPRKPGLYECGPCGAKFWLPPVRGMEEAGEV